jgi:redox-sensing transcriptional repressor
VAIIAVPGPGAQEIADDLAEAGVKGIMNFTPLRLSVPDTVRVMNVDLSNELQSLIYFVQYSDSIIDDGTE